MAQWRMAEGKLFRSIDFFQRGNRISFIPLPYGSPRRLHYAVFCCFRSNQRICTTSRESTKIPAGRTTSRRFLLECLHNTETFQRHEFVAVLWLEEMFDSFVCMLTLKSHCFERVLRELNHSSVLRAILNLDRGIIARLLKVHAWNLLQYCAIAITSFPRELITHVRRNVNCYDVAMAVIARGHMHRNSPATNEPTETLLDLFAYLNACGSATSIAVLACNGFNPDNFLEYLWHFNTFEKMRVASLRITNDRDNEDHSRCIFIEE